MTTLRALALLASLTSAFAAPSQIPFSSSSQDFISSFQTSELTTFKHDKFPDHTIRAIQPRGFCDSTVEQWSGYLDTPNNRHFYFW